MSSINYRKPIAPLEPYVPGKPIDDVKREFGLKSVVKIASNENPYGFSQAAKDAVVASISSAMIYPDGYCTKLRNALSKKLGVAPEQLVFGAGADEIIAMVGKVFINEGDECITGSITFSQYEATVVAMGGKMVFADLKDDTYDLDAILSKITDKTKVIFIANPNNPTGTAFGDAAQRAFLAKVPSNILVIMDEAYSEYADMPDFPKTLEYLNEYKNVMLMKTFSKIYGLASFRVGYGVACPEIITLFEKIRCPFNVSSQAQEAALAALGDENFVFESNRKNVLTRNFVYAELEKADIEYIETQANFLIDRKSVV